MMLENIYSSIIKTIFKGKRVCSRERADKSKIGVEEKGKLGVGGK